MLKSQIATARIAKREDQADFFVVLMKEAITAWGHSLYPKNLKRIKFTILILIVSGRIFRLVT
jgi:hypothetical protein